MRCIQCNTEIDGAEFTDPRDADICGYCLASTMSIMRDSHPDWPWQALILLAEITLRLETNPTPDEKACLERMKRAMESMRWSEPLITFQWLPTQWRGTDIE